MRVVAGTLRSRVLVAPAGVTTRPTSDRLRETLFNVLGPRVVACRFADLYAGSGAVGIEALSRGAEHCLFLEKGAEASRAIRKNVETLALLEKSTLGNQSVSSGLAEATRRELSFDLVFLDPPYEAAAEYANTLASLGQNDSKLLRDGGLVVAEHARRSTLAESYGLLRRTRVLEQGDAALSFYALPGR